MTDLVKAERIVRRWDTLARKFQYLGLDLMCECRSLGRSAAYCNSEVDMMYANYVQLDKLISAQVDIINAKIKQLIPTLT